MYRTAQGMLYRFTFIGCCKVKCQRTLVGLLHWFIRRGHKELQQRVNPFLSGRMVDASFRNVVMSKIPAILLWRAAVTVTYNFSK